MALPSPNLDDRRFQDLVDDAKRFIQQRCPEWTDHNVTDPGVTLIEAFAQMTDSLLYRLNRVPDRVYGKFLDFVGMRLLPPSPARTEVTFWLSAPAQVPISIAVGTRVATLRQVDEAPVVFSVDAPLSIVPCSLRSLVTQRSGGEVVDQGELLRSEVPCAAFSPSPAVGDALLIGLSEAVPSCAVRLRLRCNVEGVGIDPTDPPLVWESWDGADWSRCEVERDSTGGLNVDGEVVLHVDASHRAAVLVGERAGWVRARVADPEDGCPQYSESPVVAVLEAGTVGGTAPVVHAEVVEGEVLGASDGSPGQRFGISRGPVLSGSSSVQLEVGGDDGWEAWTEVLDFAASGPEDRHYVVDGAAMTVSFGPAAREPDGTLRRCGAVPAPGAHVRLRSYRIGGGSRGNVARGAIRTLKSSIPFVAAVENRASASGGVDGETMEQAKDRGPIFLRTRGRAVTAEDFEELTREAAPEVARVRCVAGDAVGDVRVLVVPSVTRAAQFEDLLPRSETLERVADRLDATRMVGTRVAVGPPRYHGLTIVAQLRAKGGADVVAVQQAALARLVAYFDPVAGGPGGDGWPWGRSVQLGEAFSVLQALDGVDVVEDVRFFGANPVTGERGPQVDRLEVDADSLVFSYQPQVRVSPGVLGARGR